MTDTDPVGLPIDPTLPDDDAELQVVTSPRAGRSLKGKVIRASAWVFSGGAIGQAIRLGTNLIIARFLLPEAFALMAVVSLFLQGLATLSEVGVGPSVIQNKRGEDDAFLRTAWTIQIVRGALLSLAAGCISVGLWVASSYELLSTDSTYGHPLLPAMLAVGGLTAVIGGFTSTAVLRLHRQLAQGRVVSMQLGSRLVSLVVMVAWVLVSPTPWALVAGLIAAATFRTVVSYLVLPGHRDHLGWDRQAAGDIIRFGRWIYVGTILSYLRTRGYGLFLAAFLPPAAMGVFSIGVHFPRAINKPLTGLNGKVMFPAYARLAERGGSKLRSRLRKVRLAFMAVTVPLLGVMVVFGQEIIDLLYTEEFTHAGWVLQVFAAAMVIDPMVQPRPALLAVGDSFRLMVVQIVTIVLLFGAMAAGGYFYGEEGLIVGAAFGPKLNYPVLVWAVRKHGLWLPEVDLARFVIGGAIVAVAVLC